MSGEAAKDIAGLRDVSTRSPQSSTACVDDEVPYPRATETCQWHHDIAYSRSVSACEQSRPAKKCKLDGTQCKGWPLVKTRTGVGFTTIPVLHLDVSLVDMLAGSA